MNNELKKIKASILAAINLEPTIDKANSVCLTRSIGHKNFYDFLISSSLISLIDIHEYNTLNYFDLFNIINYSIKIYPKFRLWGAIELLFPVANSIILKTNFMDYLRYYTAYEDVHYLENARIMLWQNSQKRYKNRYNRLGGINLLEHYHILLKYGKEIQQPTIINWCEEILNGLQIAEHIYSNIKEKPIHSLTTSITSLEEYFVRLKTNGFKTGQICDYIIVALFKYFYHDTFNKK